MISYQQATEPFAPPTEWLYDFGLKEYPNSPAPTLGDLPLSKFVDMLVDMLASPGNSIVRSSTETFSSDEPIHAAAEALVKQVLGKRACERFSELKNINEGWNFGAESNLAAFLSRIQHPPENPRLFLLDDGAIEVQWRNLDNKRVSVISTTEGFEVLRQDSQEEQRFSDSDFERLLQTVGLIDLAAA